MIGFVVKGHIYYIKFGFSKFSKKQKQQKQLYFEKKKYSNVINSINDKAEFSGASFPVFSVSWYFINHYNMLILCSTFL